MLKKLFKPISYLKTSSLFNKSQFLNYKLNSNNELKTGDIPFEINYDRKIDLNQLENGINVCSVKSNSDLCTISVFIKAGSRHEKRDSSGTAHFLEHMHFKGTDIRNRDELNFEIEKKGGLLNAYTSREFTSYILNFSKHDLKWAINLLGDILINSKYDNNLIDLERDTIYQELLESNNYADDTLLDYSHMNCFKNHEIGNPILGLKENIYKISRNQIIDFHNLNYIGKNISIVGYGNYDHNILLNETKNSFGRLKKISENYLEQHFNEKPKFNSTNLLINTKEVYDDKLKINIFYETSSWTNPFYFVNQILLNYLDKYEYDENNIYNDSKYNISNLLHKNPKISKVYPNYIIYEDTGLFGFYFDCEYSELENCLKFQEEFLKNLINNIDEELLMKARSSLFNELMNIENGEDITQEIGTQLLILKRIIPRSELAKRISYLSKKEFFIENLKNILSKPPSITIWGEENKIKDLKKLIPKFQKIIIE